MCARHYDTDDATWVEHTWKCVSDYTWQGDGKILEFMQGWFALMEDLGYNATELMEHIAERRRKTSASRGGGAVLRGGATPSGGAFERHPAVGHRSADARAREMQRPF